MSKIKAFTTSTGALGQMIYRQPRTLMTGQIVVETKLQVRVEGLDEERVENYAQLLRDGQILPAIKVFQIEGKFYVVDGFHRLEAHRRAGLDTIECLIEQGTFEQAFDLAAEENLRHGLGLSDDSKKHLLEHYSQPGRKWHTASTRVIAAELQVGHSTISRWKAQLYQMGQLMTNDKVVGADGRTRDVSGIRDAAQNRQTPDPEPDEDWQEEREQLQAALKQLNVEREQAYKAWQAAKAVEEGLGQSLEEVNRARHKRVQAEADYNRLAGQMEGLQERINAAIAIKQQIPPKPTKADGQLEMKLAFAVQKGWVDSDQADLHTWEDLDPFNATRFRLKNLVTGVIVDPHSRPADVVEREIKAVQAAEESVNGTTERLTWQAKNGQQLRLTWLPKSGFIFVTTGFMTNGSTPISVVLDYDQAEELANALISRIEDYDSRL